MVSSHERKRDRWVTHKTSLELAGMRPGKPLNDLISAQISQGEVRAKVGVVRVWKYRENHRLVIQRRAWLVRTGRHSRSHYRESKISILFSGSARKRSGKFKTATHELMVRMAFSPRDIWGTPSSQPIHQVSKLKEALSLPEDSVGIY